MRKLYAPLSYFKKIAFTILNLLLFWSVSQAQTDVSIGTGTTGNDDLSYPAPLQDFYEGSRAQYLYRATELTSAGMGPGNLTAVKFNVTNLFSFAGTIQQYTIKIGTTSAASLGTTTWENVSTTVYGPFDYVPTLGINTFVFSAPFFWNGTDNIVVEICNGLPANTTDGLTHFTDNVSVPWTTGLSFNGSHTYRADNLGNLCGSTTTTNSGTQTTRPNITFSWIPAVACNGAPNAGTATTTASTVCMSQLFTLGLSGVTVASGLTYQWQSSTDNTNWTNISGATTNSVTISQSVSTYYRAVVTCNGTASANSSSVLVTSPALVSGIFTINKDLPTDILVGRFSSFNAAYDYIKCGINGSVTFNVVSPIASGAYNEQLIMQPVPGASATRTVTFNGNGRTLSFTSSNTNERAVIKLNGADHITFNDLIITAGGTTTSEYGFGVQLINDADSNKVNGCTINITAASTSTNYAGIVVSASATSATGTGSTLSDGNIFTNNIITGGYYGITLVGSTTEAVRLNQILNNTIREFYIYGIYLSGNFSTLIDSNRITRPTRTVVSTGSTYGIYMTSLNVSLNISRNRIFNLFGGATASTGTQYGIYTTGTDALGGLENKIVNNAIYNTNNNGGDVYGIYNSGSDNIWYHHNSIVLDGAASGSSVLTRGFYQTTEAAGVEFKNNVIYISRTGSGAKHALFFNTTTSTIASNNNDLYFSTAAPNHYIGAVGTTNYLTLANWQTGATQDAASVSANPVFVDPSTGNYAPTNTVVNDKAAPLGVSIDINGNPRNAANPDMGAWEFTPLPCPVPPVPGTTTVNLVTVCVNSPVSFGLTGNSVGLTQTYQWQSSSTLGGTYTNVGVVLNNPDTSMAATTTQYYRVALTCGTSTTYSTPVLLTVSQRMPAGTYTINSTNATNYTGTAPANFKSFNDAKNALQCGVAGAIVFNVQAGLTGVYNEQLILDSIPGTSSTNTVTFNGNGNTIRFSSDNTDERAVILLRGADHIRFDSLVIDATGANTYGWGVQLLNNADSNIVHNCVINTSTTSTSTNYAGIVVSASENGATTTGATLCDGNKFNNNTINGGYYGLTLVGSTTTAPAIQNNQITNNTFRNFYTYGIYLNGTFNTLVQGNDLSRATRTSTTTFYGIYATGLSTKLLVDKNRIHNPFDGNQTSTSDFYGIYFTGVDALSGVENIVSNNAIYNVTGNGDEHGIYNAGSDNALYYHNTISLDNAASTHTASFSSRGLYQTTEASGIQYKNNIVSIARGGAGDRHAIYMASSTTGYQSTNNNFYVSGPANVTFIGYDGTDRKTLADWQTATGKDANSRSVNPMYTSAATGDLRPRNPNVDNIGTPVGITTDILNAARSATTPDAGAWEFAIPACTAPPVGGTATAIPNSNICMDAEIRLALTGTNTLVSGQTYQWQYASSATGPWTNLGNVLSFPDTTINATTTLYYRVVVTCSGQSSNSTPVLVTLNAPFPGGIYTINPADPQYPAATNFKTFAAAVAAMECGITDDVIFNVVPGTYTEKIRMHRIPGASDTSRVTFQSQNGNPASVTLTFASTAAAANYTLQLDSASYITWKNMTINATNSTNGRAIEIANNASRDSLLNLRINVPTSSSTSNAVAGIYSGNSVGVNNVIKGNTITGGSSGIYFAGSSAANSTDRNLIDSNTINNPYYYGMYISNNHFATISRNKINRTAPTNTTGYAMYLTGVDSAYQIVGNDINVTNVTTTNYGLYMTGNNAKADLLGRVANNRIRITGTNTGTVYGMYQSASTFNHTVNNDISIHTTGASSYALYSTGGGDLKYYNNSVNSTATSTTANYAAYFAHTSGSGADVRNNIFAHHGGGRAMYIGSDGYISSDYNMVYTTGTNLVQRGTPAGLYTSLGAWITASGWDQNSIVFKPAFNSNTDLTPKLNDSTVWAMHGRGVQIDGNNYDFNNNPRPTILTAGVPDLGAYEFLPTVAPMPLQGTPATPAPGITQVFMFGTDTVSKITWDAGTTVPSSIVVRRYSGVLPTGTTASQSAMYFYVKADVTGTTTPKFNLKQFYIDPWQGFISREVATRLGRTNAANTWIMDPLSRVDTVANVISRDTLNFIDRFTGLTDNTIAVPPPPVYVQQVDSSNRGKRFWVGYAHSYNFFSGSNSQDMVLYLGAGSQPATVTVRITGTSWVKTYSIPANTAITSDIIPKTGIYDARLLIEGKTPRGILIESDVPISAYAHIYASTNSGATMLMPVGVYGYEYYTLNSRQNYTTSNSHSSFFVVADRDNTNVEITPSNPTSTGKPAGVPFTVTLNAGEVYQILGAYISGAEGYDLTGSIIKSIPNSAGRCYPIGVFAGSTRTYITCGGQNSASGGDLIFQQVFPSQAWGTKYLTAPTSTDASASTLMTNIYRVMVKDPSTVVTVNGAPINAPLTANRYYQYQSGTADYIQADKPIMVAQYMASSGGGCPNTSGDGDPEMFYISPIEQAVNEAPFYRNTLDAIDVNYLTLIIDSVGFNTLTVDNSSVFDHVYTHPNNARYKVVVKRFPTGSGQSFVKSDSAFTGIVYGLGSVESYGYNVGTLVKNLNAIPSISNTLSNSTQPSSYTCQDAPFRFNILLPLKPTQLVWQFSQVTGLTPTTNVVQSNPTAADSTQINGRWYYRYTIAQDYRFAGTGYFNVPISISHPTIEGCSNSFERLLTIEVKPAPNSDFSVSFSNCVGDVGQFAGTGASTINGVTVTAFNWNFGDNTTGNGQTTTHQFTTPNTYNVSLNMVTSDGCLGQTTKPVTVNPRPVVTLVSDSVVTCPNVQATIQVQNPAAGATYNWYTAPTGGTAVHTGTSYSVTLTTTTVYYVEGVQAGCSSTSRKRVVVDVLPVLAAPAVQVTDRTPNSLTFSWNQVAGATGYEVSTNGGTSWAAPSTGTGGAATSHTITGLQPLTSVTLLVRAIGGCQEVRSQPVIGQTLTDQVYIPNSFTPNGDGVNDVLRVYGNVIRGMQFIVFNQWGEKIFESNTLSNGWDGSYKGKQQPSGVYIYVVKLTLNDGSTMDKKGTINLVR